MSKQHFYWLSQICGWLVYVILIWIINRLEGENISPTFYLNLAIIFILGVGISHLYRSLIIRLEWLSLRIIALIPRMLLASMICGLIYFMLHSLITDIFIRDMNWFGEPMVALMSILNLSANFVLWSLLYFLFHFIESYRKEEIKNLEWEALSREVELNRLKSQMNPHFIFNAMNTIRALVDEDPKQSKEAITQLSNILRNSLFMGRSRVITLSEEIQLVKDYLNIEKARFEERLEIDVLIPEDVLNFLVPPLLIQTLVENGIKHGIANLPEGGKLAIIAKITPDHKLVVVIENDGEYLPSNNKRSGFGLINSRQRINLLYGDQGSINIENTKEKVRAILEIPPKPKGKLTKRGMKKNEYENIDN